MGLMNNKYDSLVLVVQVQLGLAAGAAKQELYLVPLSARHRHGPELHATAAVVQLLESYN